MERATIDRDTFVRPNARPSAGVRATLIAGTVTLGGDLYGQWVEVRLCSRLRLQRRAS